MEIQKKSNASKWAIVCVVGALVIGVGAWYAIGKDARPKFCFDFSYNMQYGDRTVKNPVNQGSMVGNMTYYVPELPALQVALIKQGFKIDDFETTGGKVYAGPFFGPSTKTALLAFQKKNDLPETGDVNDLTTDRLSKLYKCPPSTPSATSTKVIVGTTTPLR